jgi:hypothetical protein
VQAAAAAVWIQLGIGLWMLASRDGWSSRLAGLSGAAWGLIVWVFGEAFGGIFAPGLSWLSGAPGAVTLYIVAGVLLALPARAWTGHTLGRLLLAGARPGRPACARRCPPGHACCGSSSPPPPRCASSSGS